MYYELVSIITEMIYGVESYELLTTYQQLTTTQLATVLSVFTALLPFIVVFLIIRSVIGSVRF